MCRCAPRVIKSYAVSAGETCTETESKEKTWCMGPYAGVDHNLTLCPLYCRLQHITMGTSMPESTLSPSQGLWIWQIVTRGIKVCNL
jgi:hypothetical protein